MSIRKALRFNIIFVVFITLILEFYFNNRLTYLTEILLVGSLLFMYIFKKNKYNITFNNNIYFVAFFLIVFLIQCIRNINSIGAIVLFTRIVLINSLLFKILKVYGKEYIKHAFILIIVLMFILNFISIFEFINKTSFYKNILNPEQLRWLDSIGQESFRVRSVFVHPIIYGTLLNINLIVLIYLKKYFNKQFYYINYLLIIVNLYATKSRSCWITFVILILLIYTQNFKFKNKINKKRLINNYFIIFIIIIFIIIFSNNISNILEGVIYRFTYKSDNDISKLQRIGTIRNIIQFSFSRWTIMFFGMGINTVGKFMLSNPVILPEFASTDNQYMTFLYEMGIIFLISFLIYFLYNLLKMYRCKNLFSKVIILIMISIAINMFFYNIYGWKIVLFFLMGSVLLSSIATNNKIECT